MSFKNYFTKLLDSSFSKSDNGLTRIINQSLKQLKDSQFEHLLFSIIKNSANEQYGATFAPPPPNISK